MSHRGGYQGGPPKEYSEGYSQGGQGKRPWRQSNQPQHFSQHEGYYSEEQYSGDPNQSSYRGYQDQYEDPYYYQQGESSGWDPQGYPDQYEGYYQGQRSYHQGGEYQTKKKGHIHGHSSKNVPPQKTFKKEYPQPQSRKYHQEQGNFGKGGYIDPSLHEKHNFHESYSHKEISSGTHSKYLKPTSQKGSADSKQNLGQKASSMIDPHHAVTGGQGATKPAYGHYYTQKRYLEQEQLKKMQQTGQNPNEPTEGMITSAHQVATPQSAAGKGQTGTSASFKLEPGDQSKSREHLSFAGAHNEIEDERFTQTMAKFNTLDRGTYFVREDNKKAHFLVVGRSDLLGWKDTFVINGYLLHGVVLKLMTLTSRIFLFIENLHSIYHQFVKIAEDGETAMWTDAMPDQLQIVSVTSIEKVEVLDNDEDGFEGFVCYTVCEDSKIEFNFSPKEIEEWNYVQELILLYEPTSIRKIYLDVVYNSIYKPESKGFGGKRIAAIVNPHEPGQTIQYEKKVVTALEKQCVVGTIWIQNGRYTLIAETVEDMERLVRLVDMALDIAEELNSYVMITNLRRTFDFAGKTVLYISSDPTLKLIRSSNAITFASKIKKSENLI